MTMHYIRNSFNTQPPEGGWNIRAKLLKAAGVSTHSHPKVAGCDLFDRDQLLLVSTHSHPKVAGAELGCAAQEAAVSTHSHPKVAGFVFDALRRLI